MTDEGIAFWRDYFLVVIPFFAAIALVIAVIALDHRRHK